MDVTRTDGYSDELIKDVKNATGPGAAAAAFATLLIEKWTKDRKASYGPLFTEDEFTVHRHEDRTCVVWESGPFEWSLDVLGGETIGSREFHEYRSESDVFPDIFEANDNIWVEAENRYAVAFYEA